MTTLGFTKIPTSTRFKEEGTGSLIGVRSVQYAAWNNANIDIDEVDGWHELGYLEDFDYNGNVEEYIAAGGVPETDLGVRKTAHKKDITLTLSYPEEKAIALAKSLGSPTVNYPGVANDTTVDTGTAPTATTITVNAGDGSNYSAGDLIEIVVGDSTNGTASVFRRIDSISTDTFTFTRPLGELPENGAAVKEVESIDYIESTDEYPTPIMLRFIENDNANSAMTIEQILKFQPTLGSITPGNGKDHLTVTIVGKALGEYDSANDRYNISKRRTLALNP